MLARTSRTAGSGTCDLDREERIAARGLRDPRDHGARRRKAEAFAHDVMQRREGKRPQDDTLKRVRRQRAVELERHFRRTLTASGDEQPQLHRQSAYRELQRPSRRQIDPLHVVDRHQHRLLADEFSEHPDDSSRHSPRIGGLAAGDTQQRGGKRKLLRTRELRTRLVERRTDDVSQRRIGKLRLALGRPSPQHPIPTSLRETNGLEPDRRLPDPSLAFNEQRPRAARRGIKERRHHRDLPLTADHRRLMRDPPSHESRLCALLTPVYLHICSASRTAVHADRCTAGQLSTAVVTRPGWGRQDPPPRGTRPARLATQPTAGR